VGTLLLDPADFYIQNSKPPTDASWMTPQQVEAALATSNLVIATNNSSNPPGQNGDIFVNDSIPWSTNNSLMLSAYRNIDISTNSVKIANFAGGNLVLRADSTGTGQGTVVFDHGAHVDYPQSIGTVSIFYNPMPPPRLATNMRIRRITSVLPCPGGGGVFVQQPSQLTPYMLVNTASDLDAVRTNLSGTYALGRDINAGSIANFTPIATFSGLFEGQNQTISNLTIKPVDSTTQNIGLFGTIARAGEVRNLHLTNVSVNSSVSSQSVGTVAGTNAGTVSDVSATGLVQVGSGSTAGGLVEQNLGSISNSFASIDVGSPNVANLQVGGLVGNNSGAIFSSVALGHAQAGDASIAGGLVASNSVSGPVTGSQASGNVTVAAASFAGGLVGTSAGAVTASTASGAVSSTGANSTVGGLVGANAGTITDSIASGAVTSSANSTVGALFGTSSGTVTNSTGSGVVTSTGSTLGAWSEPAPASSRALPPLRQGRGGAAARWWCHGRAGASRGWPS
jgi:mucin-19